MMKYFTKEWYDEMQVAGFLVFHETLEEWKEEEAFYKEEGHDFKEINLRNLNDMRGDLMKFLPESFHPYILSNSLTVDFPSPELREMAGQWEKEYEARMEALDDIYSRHYESIKDKLPAGAIQLMEQSLHDATVLSVEKLENELIVTLDCSGGFHYFTDIQLTFTGVAEASIPEEFTGAWWLYNEIYLKDNGFELHVLFDCPMTEAKIIAQDVRIEELK